MQNHKKDEFVCRNSLGRIRVIKLGFYYNIADKTFTIYKKTGMFGGKLANQTPKVISNVDDIYSVGLSIYNDTIKMYLDRGYLYLNSLTNKDLDSITLEELDTLIPVLSIDARGIKKLQVPKSSNTVATKYFDRCWWECPEYLGLRVLIFYKKHKIKILHEGNDISRYLPFTTNENLKTYFENNPKVLLEATIYQFGRNPETLTKMCYCNNTLVKNTKLIILDIVDENTKFSKRLVTLEDIVTPYFTDDSQISVIAYKPISGWTRISTVHNRYITEGYEGIYLKSDTKYECGKRSMGLIYMREYDEGKFEVYSYRIGIDKNKDFYLKLRTSMGILFEVKLEHIDDNVREEFKEKIKSMVGMRAVISYLYYNEAGKPHHPTFKYLYHGKNHRTERIR